MATGGLDACGVKARILAAGRAEFARHGVTAGSVRAIGAEAGVTAAMINYYFGGKRALYDAVVAEAQGRLRDRIAPALAEPGRPGLAARLAGAYFDFLAEDRELQRLLLHEVLDGGDGVRALASRYVAPLRALLRQHFGDDDEALHLAVSLFGAVAGYFLYEPVLAAFFGEAPRSAAALARRRSHVVRLARALEEMPR
ncbi:MAG: TetR/AcrR family transcriptional regulator [Deltaproteobacteria bacterium]|nr:TetR/AcrR family transcriptional regulator [Deltaproteobacteria bacterium]